MEKSVMERTRIVKDEITEQDLHFLAVYLETKNAVLVLLSEKEDKLGTLAIAVPKSNDSLGPPPSSTLLGDRNAFTARMFAEHVAARMQKIALVSIYLETVPEPRAQSIFMKLVEKVLRERSEAEAAAS